MEKAAEIQRNNNRIFFSGKITLTRTKTKENSRPKMSTLKKRSTQNVDPKKRLTHENV